MSESPVQSIVPSERSGGAASGLMVDFHDLREQLLLKVDGYVADAGFGPTFQATASCLRQWLDRQLSDAQRSLADLIARRVALRDIETVRSTVRQMFTALALDAAHTGRPSRYLSVSLCDEPDYFERPFIKILGLELDDAVTIVAEKQAPKSLPLVAVDRILVVPSRVFPEPAHVAFDEMRTWWDKVYRSLGERMSVMETVGPHNHLPVEIALKISHDEAVNRHNIPLRGLDFGLYGEEAVGVYTADTRDMMASRDLKETLVVHEKSATGPAEFADCMGRWNALQHRSLPSLSWRQLVSRLRLGGPIQDPT